MLGAPLCQPQLLPMKSPSPSRHRVFEDKAFVFLVIAVSAAFAWILWPFFGAIFWAAVLAIVFSPLYLKLTKALRQRRVLAALTTLLLIVLIVILPTAIITSLLLQEGLGLYARIKSGELDFGAYLQQILGALPPWAMGLLERFGLTDFASVQERLSAGLMRSLQFMGAGAVSFGQNAFEALMEFFIMLYLLFFLLRDGPALARDVEAAVPLDPRLQRSLGEKFINVVRATIKGTIVIALIQGALGGLVFWFLDIRAPVFWGVVMAFLSLLPAIGTALVWLPVAIYFLVTGAIWQGVVLIAFGVLVIGLVDNVVRPILVGKDTKIPDYIVLIATLGGMTIFGLNGFVIGPLIAAMFIAVWAVVARSNDRVR
jgi:predicted PurR-regulated permease PerM